MTSRRAGDDDRLVLPRRGVAVVLAAGLLGLAACGGDDDEPTGGETSAETTVCESMHTLAAAVTNLRGVEEQGSAADIEAAQESLERAYKQVVEDARVISEADADVLEEEGQALEEAADAIPSGTSPGEREQLLEPQLDALQQTWRQLYLGFDCSAVLDSGL